MGGSHYIAARRADPDAADALLDRLEADERAGKRQAPWRPADTEFRLEHELLSKQFDRLGEILAVLASQPLPKKAKPKKPPPRHPRPVNGLDLARSRRRNAYLASIEADVEVAQARWLAQQQQGSPQHN